MKNYRLAILFTQPPFGSAVSREGLDALLAASAYCDEDEIAICFLFDGVFNLLAGQAPEQILQKDHISTFKLLELYELGECFADQESLQARTLGERTLILPSLRHVPRDDIFQILQRAEKVLTF